MESDKPEIQKNRTTSFSHIAAPTTVASAALALSQQRLSENPVAQALPNTNNNNGNDVPPLESAKQQEAEQRKKEQQEMLQREVMILKKQIQNVIAQYINAKPEGNKDAEKGIIERLKVIAADTFEGMNLEEVYESLLASIKGILSAEYMAGYWNPKPYKPSILAALSEVYTTILKKQHAAEEKRKTAEQPIATAKQDNEELETARQKAKSRKEDKNELKAQKKKLAEDLEAAERKARRDVEEAETKARKEKLKAEEDAQREKLEAQRQAEEDRLSALREAEAEKLAAIRAVEAEKLEEVREAHKRGMDEGVYQFKDKFETFMGLLRLGGTTDDTLHRNAAEAGLGHLVKVGSSHPNGSQKPVTVAAPLKDEHHDFKKAETWIGGKKFELVVILKDLHEMLDSPEEKLMSLYLIFQLMLHKRNKTIKVILNEANNLFEKAGLQKRVFLMKQLAAFTEMDDEFKPRVLNENDLLAFTQLVGQDKALFLPADDMAHNVFATLYYTIKNEKQPEHIPVVTEQQYIEHFIEAVKPYRQQRKNSFGEAQQFHAHADAAVVTPKSETVAAHVVTLSN